MNFKTKMDKCNEFFNELIAALCARGIECDMRMFEFENNTTYLCPAGTTNEVTYYGKPEMSFRISDHWNWYADIADCSSPNYIQCRCNELPWARKRPEEGKASEPIKAASVCVFKDGKYHVVYGECFDKKAKIWKWCDNSVEKVLSDLGI